MSVMQIVLWTLGACSVVCACYGLHRLCLWLEERGQLYYLHKKPGGSAPASLVELQKIVEPQTRHVIEVKEQKRAKREENGDGPKDA